MKSASTLCTEMLNRLISGLRGYHKNREGEIEVVRINPIMHSKLGDLLGRQAPSCLRLCFKRMILDDIYVFALERNI